MKYMRVGLIILVVAVVLLFVGCSSDSTKTEMKLMGFEYIISDTLSDGTAFADGFAFSDELYYVMYNDGELLLFEKWGTWDRSGDTLYLNYDDGSSDTATIVSTRERSDGNKEVYQISINGNIYTLNENA
jgi:hypothetical protein